MCKSFVSCVALLAVLFCGTLPAHGLNIGEERQIGEKLLFSVRHHFKLIDSPDITAYITDLGNSVLDVSGAHYFDYHFFIIDSREFNAFAAPSGLIFFYSGLVEAMGSEDELVAVLGHEIGHIKKRHLATRLEKSKYQSLATLGLAVASIAFGGTMAPALLTGTMAANQSITLHFSRKDEEEADLLAYQWMKMLGRDVSGQVRMLRTMRRIARYRSDTLPQYLLTHPNPEARLNLIEGFIDTDTEYKSQRKTVADDVAFLRFKYRILTLASSATNLRGTLDATLNSQHADVLHKDMARYGMAELARSEKDFDRARQLLEEVQRKYPDFTPFLVDRAVLEFEAGNLLQAEEMLLEARAKNAFDIYATYYLGKLLQQTKREEQALELYKIVEYEQPQFADIYFVMGQIYTAQKKRGLTNLYLGKYFLYRGKFDLAVESFEKAIKDPDLTVGDRENIAGYLEQIKRIQN